MPWAGCHSPALLTSLHNGAPAVRLALLRASSYEYENFLTVWTVRLCERSWREQTAGRLAAPLPRTPTAARGLPLPPPLLGRLRSVFTARHEPGTTHKLAKRRVRTPVASF